MGAMQLVNKFDGDFDERDVERARSISSAVAIALSNALLFEESEVRQKQLEATFEYTDSPTVLVDKELRILLMNQKARRMFNINTQSFGHTAAQVIKQPALLSLLDQKPRQPVQKNDFYAQSNPLDRHSRSDPTIWRVYHHANLSRKNRFARISATTPLDPTIVF